MFCAFCTTFLFIEDSLGVIVNSLISVSEIDPKTDKFLFLSIVILVGEFLFSDILLINLSIESIELLFIFL